MAYSVPKQWSQGEYPTAAEMQKYSDGLNYIYEQMPTLEEFAVKAFGTYGVMAPGITIPLTSVTASFVHVFRWLIYKGSGRIYSGSNSASLADASGGATNIFDLDGVQWLTYGMTYYVTGVEVCLEDVEA